MTDESACNCYRPWSGGRFPIKEPCPVHSTTSSVPARCGSVSKSVIAKLQEIANQYPAHIFTVEGRTSDGIAGTAIRERMLAEIRMLQEQNASSAQAEPWKCPSCRSICDPSWKRCPYCTSSEGERLAYLIGQYDRLLAVLEKVCMDTPEDQARHRQVVETFRAAAEPIRRSLSSKEKQS